MPSEEPQAWVDNSLPLKSTSFPFPLAADMLVVDGLGAPGDAGSDNDVFANWLVPPSCQAGMDGLEGIMGVEAPLTLPGPLLSSSALRDFNSC